MRPLILCSLFTLSLGCSAAPDSSPTPPPSAQTTPRTQACDEGTLGTLVGEQLSHAAPRGAVVVIDLQQELEVAAGPADDPRPPGSSVKPLVAMAGLGQQAIRPDDEVTCDGTWERGEVEVTCFGEHGSIDLANALASSCNAYTYEVAHRLGAEQVAAIFDRYGLEALAQQVRATKGDLGAFLATALGHGDAAVTPRQLAQAWAQMVTRGDPGWADVAEGLRAAVTGRNGTARRAAGAPIAIAGKTGTAESHAPTKADRGAAGDETSGQVHTHAWFAGYAPADDPRWVIVAWVPNAGTGGEAAAPLAADVLEAVDATCRGD